MKKSLVFMIAVLLVGALMISCNSEVAGNAAGDGKVVTVGVNLDNSSKALQTSVANDTNVAGLYWYYTATKTDGSLFITGQTSGLTPIDANSTEEGYQAGLQGAVLGDFSTGGWKFSFFGYSANVSETFNESSSPAGNPVYKCENLAVSITADTNLNVTIEAGEGMGPAKLVFDNPTWTYSLAPVGTSLTLKVNDETSQIATDTASTDTNGMATFSQLPSNLTLSAGSHTLTFNVFYGSEQVGQATLSVVAKNGTTITVSGSIENLDSLNTVTVATVTNTVATAEITPTSDSTTVVTAAVTPASASAVTAQETTNTTKVTFPSPVASSANNDDGTTTVKSSALTIDVSTLEDANSNPNFTVATGSSAVAAIDLSLTTTTTEKQGDTVLSTSESNVTGNFGGSGIVKVETFIAKNLTDISMKYGDETFTRVDSENAVNANHKFFYVPETGRLVFATDHFSEFYVTSTDEAYNATLGKAYATLTSALTAEELADNHTVMLLKNIGSTTSPSSISYTINKRITLDGNNKKIYGNGAQYTGTDAFGTFVNTNKASIIINDDCTLKDLKVETKDSGSSSCRAIAITSSGKSINIEKCEMIASCVMRIERFDDDNTTNLKITNSIIDSVGYYGIYTFSKINAEIDDCTFRGWNALYFKGWSNGSTATVKRGYWTNINSSNTAYSNSFASIVFEDGNVTVDLEDCQINSYSTGPASQWVILNSYFRQGCLDGTSYGSGYMSPALVNGTHRSLSKQGNIIKVSGGNTNLKMYLYSDGLYNNDKESVAVSSISDEKYTITHTSSFNPDYDILEEEPYTYSIDKIMIKNNVVTSNISDMSVLYPVGTEDSEGYTTYTIVSNN